MSWKRVLWELLFVVFLILMALAWFWDIGFYGPLHGRRLTPPDVIAPEPSPR